jgi:formylglycine-generating enzyme required for sulfatase activity
VPRAGYRAFPSRAGLIRQSCLPVATACLAFLLAPPATADTREVIGHFPGMRFVPVPAGEFTMGRDDVEAARRDMPDPGADAVQDEIPARRVEISRPFCLDEMAVSATSRYLAARCVE